MGPRGSLGQAVVSSGISVWLHFHSSHVRPRGSLGQAVVSSGISVWLHFHSSHMRLRGSLGQAVVSVMTCVTLCSVVQLWNGWRATSIWGLLSMPLRN